MYINEASRNPQIRIAMLESLSNVDIPTIRGVMKVSNTSHVMLEGSHSLPLLALVSVHPSTRCYCLCSRLDVGASGGICRLHPFENTAEEASMEGHHGKGCSARSSGEHNFFQLRVTMILPQRQLLPAQQEPIRMLDDFNC